MDGTTDGDRAATGCPTDRPGHSRDVDADGEGVQRRAVVEEAGAAPKEDREVVDGHDSAAEGDRARDLDEIAELQRARNRHLDERTGCVRDFVGGEDERQVDAAHRDGRADGNGRAVVADGHLGACGERPARDGHCARELSGDAA